MSYRHGTMILSECDTCDIYDNETGLVVVNRSRDSRGSSQHCRYCEPLLFEEAAQRDKDAWLRGSHEADVRMGYVVWDRDADTFVVNDQRPI